MIAPRARGDGTGSRRSGTKKALLRVVFGAALACFCSLGCAAILGIELLPRGECTLCEEANCRSAKAACWNDAACLDLYTCLSTCELGDLPCRLACEDARPKAVASPVAQALDVCRRAACADDCYGIEGVLASYSSSPECTACLTGACADLSRACIQSGIVQASEVPGQCERDVL